MKKLVVAGAGGFAKEVLANVFDANNIEKKWDIIGCFDDDTSKINTTFNDVKVLGNIDAINEIEDEVDVIIASGKPTNILSIKKKLYSAGLAFPNLIHPSVPYNSSIELGEGNIMQPYSYFSVDIKIGNFNLFNVASKVGHDTNIGNYNIFGPSTLISGGVTIGDENQFGINSGVLQYKKVGNGNIIGPMSVLVRTIKNNGHYLGVPAMPTHI